VLSFAPLLLAKSATRKESIARLQSASGIPHRPITAYTDTLSSTANAEASTLWQAHRSRAAGLIARLKAGAPHPRIDRHDPLALRAALVLLLAVVIAWQWTGLGKQIAAAFDIPAIEDAGALRIDAWVTPPPYTRRAPFALPVHQAKGSAAPGPIETPQGSSLTLKVNHPDAARFALSWADGKSDKPEAIARSDQSRESFASFSTTLKEPGRLVLNDRGREVESWPIAILPDDKPKIAFAGPIEVSQRSAVLFRYQVEDDYGVVSAEAHIERVDNGIAPGESATGAGPATSLTPKQAAPVRRLGKPPVFPLSLPHGGVKSGEAKTYKDLTAHPWAGLPVIVTLIARDEAGQTGQSAPRGFILPERKFTKPLARALIDQRRALVENPVQTKNARLSFDALARFAESEGMAPSIYLGIRSVYWRLENDQSIESVESVVDQLWDLAVKIEDGDLPAAERELRAAQQRLMDALQNGASPEEIQKLMAELRQSLNKFLQALAAKQQRDQGRESASNDGERSVTASELQQLLNKIEDLAKLGSKDSAQQLLSELQDILENLQSGQNGQESAGNAESMKRLDELSQMMRDQQKLLDQTFRAQQDSEFDPFGSQGEQRQQGGQQQNGQPQSGGQGQQGGQGGQQGGQSASALQQRQQDLQKQLQQLLDKLKRGSGDPVKEGLQDADRAMGNAGKALGKERLGEAAGEQRRALNAMRQGAKQMAEQMMNSPGARQGGRSRASRDPLGRRNEGQLDPGDSVKVPEEIDIQRARESLDELRKRAGEQNRPALELDYIERLIKRF
jgi:uncharacterized protein (TIGR02302 family)